MTTDDTTTQTANDDSVVNPEQELALLKAESESLKQELELLQAELEKDKEEAPEALKELAARAQADLQNAKERMEREKRDIRQFALEGTIVKLLPTIDNFQRAFSHLPEDLAEHDWVKGVSAVEKEFMTMLAESGFTKIEVLGKPVDTKYHEVLQMGPGEKDIILQEFEAGYTLNEKVLRPAKVKVGNGEAA